VPGEEPGVDVVQEGTHKGESLLAFAPGGLPDAPEGDGVNRRLGKAAGVGRSGRGVGGSRGASPVLRTGVIAVGRGLRVKDDVGNLAGPPLVVKEATELAGGAADVEVGEPDGYERTIPAPLVGIEPRCGASPPPHIVLV
jgi:hypothetical protein